MSDYENPKNYYIFNDIKQLIDQKIYHFLFILIKNIFLKKDNKEKSNEALNKLNSYITIINEKFLENDEEKKISLDYSKKNLFNILKFIKSQNKLYAAEILENILIIIFSFCFETKKENTFGKYIYNNMQKLKDPKNEELAKWFKPEKFHEKIFKDIKHIKELLKNDIYIQEKLENKLNQFQKDNIFYHLLIELYTEKYTNSKFKSYKKCLNYIHKGNIETFNNEKKKSTLSDAETYSNIFSKNFYYEEIGKTAKPSISLVRSFFISVYIYYQNKNSPLMKYIHESQDEEYKKKELAIIPFAYDLTGAVIESQYAGIIMAPARIEPRITELIIVQNLLK